MDIILGVDVGASGIKGSLVDVQKGIMTTERFRVETPRPSDTAAVSKAFNEVVQHFNWKGLVGCGFPSVISNGRALTAANIHESWVDAKVEQILSAASGCTVKVSNDADVAGIAAMRFGVGQGEKGVVIFITIGSGLGSAVFSDGVLVPNTELGHLYLKGHDIVAEQYAANSIRKNEELSWEVWTDRFNEYLALLEKLFTPDLIILGGGGSKKFEFFGHLLNAKSRVVPAQLSNEAGIIGAALCAHEWQQHKSAVHAKD